MGRKAPSAVVFSMKSEVLALEAELEFQLSAQGIEALADIAGSDIAEALVVAQLGGQADCLAEPIACACGRIESPVEFDFVGAAAEGLAGIAGTDGFVSVTVEKAMMNSEVGFCRKVLEVFEENDYFFRSPRFRTIIFPILTR